MVPDGLHGRLCDVLHSRRKVGKQRRRRERRSAAEEAQLMVSIADCGAVLLNYLHRSVCGVVDYLGSMLREARLAKVTLFHLFLHPGRAELLVQGLLCREHLPFALGVHVSVSLALFLNVLSLASVLLVFNRLKAVVSLASEGSMLLSSTPAS